MTSYMTIGDGAVGRPHSRAIYTSRFSTFTCQFPAMRALTIAVVREKAGESSAHMRVDTSAPP